MTHSSINKSRSILLVAAIAFTLFAGGAFMLRLVPSYARDKIADGLLADCLITFPAVYYFIIVRRLKTPVRSMGLVVTLSCIIAYFLLPEHQRGYILQVRKLISVAEALLIIYCITKFRKIRTAYRADQSHFPDPVYNLRSAVAEVLGRSLPLKLISSEVAMLRYGLFFWKKEKAYPAGGVIFSTHKESGYVAVWCILVVAVTVEIVAVHFLLLKWSSAVAVVVSVLSIYGLIFMIADLSAVVRRGILLSPNLVVLRTGLRWRACTRPGNILSIQKITTGSVPEGACFKGGAIKSHCNLLINFKEPVRVEKLYGADKMYNTLLMTVDDYDRFASVLNT